MNKFVFKISRLAATYINTTIIFVMDIFLSAVASGIVVLLVALLYHDFAALNTFAIWWILFSIVGSTIAFGLMKTYRVVIRHSSMKDVFKFFIALLVKELLIGTGICITLHKFSPNVFLVLAVDLFISLSFLVVVRALMIYVYDDFKRRSHIRRNCIKAFVFGSSEKSVSLAQRLAHSPHYKIVGFLTENKLNYKVTLAELPLSSFKNTDQLLDILREESATAIIFAREKDAVRQDAIFKMAAQHQIKTLIAPTIDEMVDGKLQSRIREVKIEDLLGRDEIKISLDEIKASFSGKTVMVTGAAGSIGSELCRQLAGFGISKLVLFDNAETPMHNLRLELEARFPQLDFIPVIGDVRLSERIDFVMRHWHPQVVFHAAAYKHVPLMEENPCEAVLVNVAGSRNVADKCIEYGVEKMVMISTDKAVNPTNIMGCTKRLAEIYVQSLGMAIESGKVAGHTQFVTTRFGNVLGSNGSVIPRFRAQIREGGPVTVTDKNIIRFFMTIPEACRLVMEAEVLPTANQICVFDMGQPVRIDDMARRMIELAGLVPDKDIKIEYTGLRPGEKLYEEVLSDTENTIPTPHKRIRIAKVRSYDYNTAREYVQQLATLARSVEIPSMVRLMKEIVPEFISKNSEFEVFDNK